MAPAAGLGGGRGPIGGAPTTGCGKPPLSTAKSARAFTTIPICRLPFPGGRPASPIPPGQARFGGRFDEAMAFLDTSREAAEREEKQREATRQRELERARQLAETQVRVARLFKRFAGGLAVALCLAVALAIWALTLRQEAKRQEAAANHYAVEANTQAKVASDNAKKAETEARSARKAEQEATVRATAEAAAKQDARAAEEAGRKLLYTTDMQLAPFVWRDDRSTARKLRTLLAKHIPDRPASTRVSGHPKGRRRPPLSPICAASSGTTTSTCWRTARPCSRGTPTRWSPVLSPQMAHW